MAEVVVFHHALGLTPGVRAFAAALEASGHRVHTPDLFAGEVFAEVQDGIGYAQRVGFDALLQRASVAVDALPDEVVYLGISLGVMPAQRFAQTRPSARGAILLEACVPPNEFGGAWPSDLPLQVHGMSQDPFFAGEGDLEVARAIAAQCPQVEVFTYPGEAHLFTDSSLDVYDPEAAELVTSRVLDLLSRIDGSTTSS